MPKLLIRIDQTVPFEFKINIPAGTTLGQFIAIITEYAYELHQNNVIDIGRLNTYIIKHLDECKRVIVESTPLKRSQLSLIIDSETGLNLKNNDIVEISDILFCKKEMDLAFITFPSSILNAMLSPLGVTMLDDAARTGDFSILQILLNIVPGSYQLKSIVPTLPMAIQSTTTLMSSDKKKGEKTGKKITDFHTSEDIIEYIIQQYQRDGDYHPSCLEYLSTHYHTKLFFRLSEIESKKSEIKEPLSKALLNASFTPPQLEKYRKLDADLHAAIKQNDLKSVKALIKKGATINQSPFLTEHFIAPLNLAASLGHFKIANFLLENYADVAISDKKGYVPLKHAYLRKDQDMIELLIGYGADYSPYPHLEKLYLKNYVAPFFSILISETLPRIPDTLRWLVIEYLLGYNQTSQKQSSSPLLIHNDSEKPDQFFKQVEKLHSATQSFPVTTFRPSILIIKQAKLRKAFIKNDVEQFNELFFMMSNSFKLDTPFFIDLFDNITPLNVNIVKNLLTNRFTRKLSSDDLSVIISLKTNINERFSNESIPYKEYHPLATVLFNLKEIEELIKDHELRPSQVFLK